MSTSTFYPLKIQKIVDQTDLAKAFYFEVPEDLKETFSFLPGQYLTVKFEINGKEERRAYSICTSPLDGELAILSKRVDRGIVSNHMNDKLSVGDSVQLMPPEGKFVVSIDEDRQKDYYFFAGGSGITPMVSIIKAVVEKEPLSHCYLYYGNKDEANIILKDILDEVQQKYAGQISVRHILSDPIRTKSGGLKGLFSKGKTSWTGWKGLPTYDNIKEFLNENPKKTKQSKYFICGPTPMMQIVQQSLKMLEIPDDEVMVEYFASPKEKITNHAAHGKETSVTVLLNGKEYVVDVPSDKTILDVLLDQGIDAPYSCLSGACSTCVAKTISGEVSMDEVYALDEKEIKSGYILVCQSHPQSDDVKIEFEN